MAHLTEEQLQEFCMTCPIAYYAGKPVPLTASNLTVSCADVVNHAIFISTRQVNSMIEKLSYADVSVIRPIVYHEVSHVILTPHNVDAGITDVCWNNAKYAAMRRDDRMNEERIDVSNVINIFEDERIETLTRDTYMDVNFYASICRLEHWSMPRKPTSIAGAFFDMIRLHDFKGGKFKWHSLYNRSRQLIVKWATLNANSSKEASVEYCNDIFDLYYDFMKAGIESGEFDKAKLRQNAKEIAELAAKALEKTQELDANDESEEIEPINPDPYQERFDGNDGNDKEGAGANSQGAGANSKDAGDDDEEDDEEDDVEDVEDEEDDDVDNIDDVEKIGNDNILKTDIETMRDIFKQEVFEKQDEQVKQLLNQKFFIKDMHDQQMGAIHKHSGKLDVKAVGRKDWKIFKQPSMFSDGSKIGKKLHLILVLDQSGSYSHNDYATNLILSSLISAEEHIKAFEFTVIKFGNKCRICDKKDRYSKSAEGTIFSKKLFDMIDSCKRQDSANFIIFLNDGSAWTDGWYETKRDIIPYMKKALDHDNCVCILDSDAHDVWFKSFKTAKVIVTDDYVSRLSDNVCEALGAMLAV